ncbi:HpcH/HpaI aldolase/citrate lyase family protein [Olsenella sp. Marseille-P4559]|jgi:2-keto-3-deoxy-L-rhamnonate aldolase RhmA|uniref:HpcH/HpaI aldolase family protein n=1 Tax=Olsenella sp. Marseille-P4559 TaxID=2364795 RepID=UPI001032040A|nr:aldolase/citrate lyase family protein [Olsenella sp. Marseille-P4559]
MENLAKRQMGGLFVQVLDSAPAVAMAQAAGFDFLFFDGEHGDIDWPRLSSAMLYAHALGLPSLVRVGELSRSLVSHTLDLGAAGVMVPMVESANQARQLVQWAKYPPLGCRSYSGGAHTGYGKSGSHAANMARANAQTLAIAQVETVEGVCQAQAIAAVGGVDALVVGPCDLAISMGRSDEVGCAEELALIEQVHRACVDCGKAFGIIGSAGLVEHFMPDVNLMVSAIDAHLLRSAFTGAVQDYERLKSAAAKAQ